MEDRERGRGQTKRKRLRERYRNETPSGVTVIHADPGE